MIQTDRQFDDRKLSRDPITKWFTDDLATRAYYPSSSGSGYSSHYIPDRQQGI